MRGDAGLFSGRQQHAVPVRLTETRARIERNLENTLARNSQRKHGAKSLKSRINLSRGKFTFRLPLPQLTEELTGHLPCDDRFGRVQREPIQQLKGLRLFGRLVRVQCVNCRAFGGRGRGQCRAFGGRAASSRPTFASLPFLAAGRMAPGTRTVVDSRSRDKPRAFVQAQLSKKPSAPKPGGLGELADSPHKSRY